MRTAGRHARRQLDVVSVAIASIFALLLAPLVAPNFEQPAEASSAEVDKSIYLDGSSSYLETPNGFLTTDSPPRLTISTWAKLEEELTGSEVQAIFRLGTGTGNKRIVLYFYNGQLLFRAFGSDSVTETEFVPSAGSWHHYAVVHDRSIDGYQIYVDGALVAEAGSGDISMAADSSSLQVGGYGEHYFKGEFDEVKVFEDALTPSELETVMHNFGDGSGTGSAGYDDANLVAYYNFNDSSGSNVATTGTANNLTITGGVTYRDVASTTTDGSDTVITFPRSFITSDGGWSVPAGVTSVRALVVGGGGGGGGDEGGGGGAGQMLDQSSVAVSGVETVKVGVGGIGSGGEGENREYGNGQSTVFDSITATGGGVGGSAKNADNATERNGAQGGSGGGGAGSESYTLGSGGIANGTGTNAGGTATQDDIGAGGGGAGGFGAKTGAAGAGDTSDITGITTTYAAGGGGGTGNSSGSGASGGSSIGGNGGDTSKLPTRGVANTGSGGGGGGSLGSVFDGAWGGSGVVIIRFASVDVPGSVQNFSSSTRLIDSDSSTDSITLNWDALTGQSPAVTKYVVEYNTDNDFTTANTSLDVNVTNSAAATPNTTTISGLTDGQTYYFRIKAVNLQGDSSWSSVISNQAKAGEDRYLQFDGTFRTSLDGSVVPSADGAEFTVEAWAYPETITGYHAIFAQGQADGDGTTSRFWMGYYVSGGEYQFHIGRDSDLGVDIPIDDPRGKWQHVAATVASDDTIKLYIDGALVSEVNNAGTDNSGTGSLVGIGGDGNTSNSNAFIGKIDQVKVWDGPLDASEVVASMHAHGDPAGVSESLLGHFDFNDFTSTGTLIDVSGNSKDLNITDADGDEFKHLVEEDRDSVSGYAIFEFTRSYLTELGGWLKPTSLSSKTQGQLVLAAGGGGGAGGDESAQASGGGGGAGGGIFQDDDFATTADKYSVIIGAGGAGGNTSFNGSNGQDSTFGSATASGGGGGKTPATAGQPGGDTTVNINGTSTTFTGSENTNDWEGGGGGAGAGSSSADFSNERDVGGVGQGGSNGGSAREYSNLLVSGQTLSLSGGGGGGSGLADNDLHNLLTTPASGGTVAGDGGGSATGDVVVQPTNGTPNRGGGGGGGVGSTDDGAIDNSGADGGSGVAILKFEVANTPTISSQPSNQSGLLNETETFSVTATVAAGDLSYQWETSDDGSSWSTIDGATSSTYSAVVTSATSGDSFRVKVTSNTDTTVTSNAATLSRTGDTVGTGVCTQGVSDDTGVLVTQSGNDCVVAFTNSGNVSWTPPATASQVQALVVAGGGGGGGGPEHPVPGTTSHVNGGGGGAGGMVETTTNLTTNTPLTVTVGAGGAGTVQNGANASAPESGDNSSLGSAATANGGGAGGYMPQVGSINSATTGGSGGGGAAQANSAYPILGASGTPGQGNSGGNGFDWDGTYQGSGGGGGAGSAGDAANRTDLASGDGGAGKASSWLTQSIWEALFTDGSATQRSLISDSSIYFSGGGGGGQRDIGASDSAGSGGIGGGGDGALASGSTGADGNNAIANSGGGGGGGTASGGAGATGIVVVKYTAVHSVSSISPETGSSKSAINVTITGSKLSPGATLKLTKDGESDVALTNVTWVSSTEITATVPANIASGTWSLVVTQDSLDVTLANSYVASGNFNVEFDELDFDFDKVSNVLSCGDGKSVGDYQVYENVMTKNGVTIDGVVITSALNNASISRYEVDARAGGEESYFQTDVYASDRRTGGYADFTFVFYLADTFVKDCDNTPDGTFGTQVTLENVNVTGIDIDVQQYNNFTSLDSYTLASNTRLTANLTADGAEDFPASGSFVAGSDGGSNDPRDQVISTYGEIDTFTVRLGSNIRNTAYFGLAFKALDWGSSSPVTVGDEYTLTYDLNNGSGTTPASVTGGVGQNITLSSGTGATRSGFTLSGWNTKADGTGISYDLSGNFSMPQNGDTLYAKWTEANYLLSYNANGGTGAPSAVTATSGEQLTISSSSPTRNEFNFAGWNTSADGSGTSVSAGSLYSMPSSDTTLFAQWSAVARSLIYDINGGAVDNTINPDVEGEDENPDNPQGKTGAAGDTFEVSGSARWAKTNNTFEGWNTAADGSGTDYAAGSQITLVAGGNTTLYAQWKPVKKRITYSANGGTGAPSAENVDAGSNYTVSATEPSRDGYTFDNWDTQADGAGTDYSGGGSITGVTENITLYAEWTIETFTLSYNKNTPGDGDAAKITPPADSTDNFNSAVTVGSITETMANYRFTGWNTEADGSGDSYTSGGSLILTENKTLYAQWIDATIEIAYNGNGGTGAPANPSTATANQPFTISATEPTRSGYTFAGWQVLDNDPSGTFAAGGTVTPVDDETLVAQWTAIDYTLSFDARGGSPDSESTKNFEELITIPSNPSRTGFTFVGWNTAALGNGTMYSAGQTFRMPASDLTLYAIWTGNPYSLIYSANGGTGAPADEVRVAGTTSQISATVPTRDGYAFAGWDTASDGSGTSYSPNGLLQMGTSNVTLYAQWTVRSYTLSFNDNNGTGGPADVNGNFGTSTTISTTIPTREGYSFVSWNTACDGSGSDFGPGATFSFGSSDVELCAIWSGTDNQLLYSPNGGTGGPGSSQVKTGATVTVSSTEPTRAGYDFAGWGTAANGSGSNYTAGDQFSMPSSATTLYALWIANPYTVYFNANGGDGSSVPSEINSKTGETVSIPDASPTRDGYTFNGWKDQSAGGGNSYTGSFVMPAGNLVLYAQWNAINYSLTYDANGGSGVPAQQTGILDERMTIASPESDPTKTGHWFAGWNTEADGTGVSYSAGEDFFMPLGGDTLYALWVPNEYKLIFNANGGSGGPATNPTDLTFGAAFNIPNEGDLSRTGYTFTYWNEEPDGSGATDYAENGTNPLTAAITITENTVLYAQWTANQYTLSFNANTGTGTVPESQTLTYQDADSGSATLPEPSQLSKANATFIGWNTAADGSGTMLSVGEEFTMPASNTVLYAQWRDIFYVVEFNAVDGSGAPEPIFAKNGDSVTVPDTEPTKSGYTFSNWEEPQSDAVFTKSQSLTMPGNNLMLFARYTAVTPSGGGGGGGLPPAPESEPDEEETEPELPETPTPPTIGGETVTPPSTPGSGGGTGSGGSTGGSGTTTVPSPDIDRPTGGGRDSGTPETEVAQPAPPRTGSIETGDPIDWFAPADNGSQYDFGSGFQSIESLVRPDGSVDYEKVEKVSPGSLQEEQISGFDPDKGLRLEVIGARTGARFVVTEANLIDSLTLLNAIRASIDAQAEEFSKIDSVLVSSTSPAVPDAWTDRELTVIRDYFEASGLEMPISLADVNFDEIDNWLTVRASGETYAPGTQVFLTLTSSPVVIGSAAVDRFGKFEVEGYLPAELLELGEHRIRVVGMRSLDGISVDNSGNVVISDETMSEIEKFDLGTQATIRILGEAPDGTNLNAIRVVPLEPVAPWWTLLFILAAALIGSAMKRYRKMTRTSTKVISSALILASAAPAVILGWLSTVTVVTWIGLALGVVATLLPLVISEKSEGSRAKSS